MGKIFIYLFILCGFAFSDYEKKYDEWEGTTIETVCLKGEVYKSETYSRNNQILVCARNFENSFDVVMINVYVSIYGTRAEIKFDKEGTLELPNLRKSKNNSALYLDRMDTFFVIEEMKKRNYMYVKIDSTVYKVNLSGFTKDLNKISGYKEKLFETGKYGLQSYLYDMDKDTKEIFQLFDNFFIEYEAYSENDLLKRIDFIYELQYSINGLGNMGYDTYVGNSEFINRISTDFIHEDDRELFMEYYEKY